MSFTPFAGTLLSKFLLYFIYSTPIKEYIKLCSSGSTVTHLRVPQVYDMPIAIGSIAEQTAIANYLDKNTAQIDAKIQLLEQKIRAYRDLKQALTK